MWYLVIGLTQKIPIMGYVFFNRKSIRRYILEFFICITH